MNTSLWRDTKLLPVFSQEKKKKLLIEATAVHQPKAVLKWPTAAFINTRHKRSWNRQKLSLYKALDITYIGLVHQAVAVVMLLAHPQHRYDSHKGAFGFSGGECFFICWKNDFYSSSWLCYTFRKKGTKAVTGQLPFQNTSSWAWQKRTTKNTVTAF